MRIDDITSLRCFKSIYETRSMTKSSIIMGLSKAALSKRVDGLESNLGFKLFTRTTRSLIPTAKADQLILKVNDILVRVDNLESENDHHSDFVTKIKITCTATMSQRFLGKVLLKYQENNPGILIELLVTDSVLELAENGIDLCIRYNPDQNSNLVGRKIGPLKLVAVATPGYLKENRPIKKMEDLIHHELLFLENHFKVFESLPKIFQEELKKKRSFITNDSPLITQLVLRGKGIGIRSSWDVIEGIQQKRLEYVLPESSFRSLGDVWILSGPDRLKSEKIRKLFDYLHEEVGRYFMSASL